ncbi:class I SAM-dependent methyltransferase [Aurantimonas coralicida]|uniref:class I SAM-dependent methyltransferase n=1 Tax=Aurantimonas coralicida TaxID=182270 RepID=UPI001D17F993|nr:class I SAM-dependent methyltransferase [Aurantimonas coralicida]MCC4297234.1 class I SAM-dependent methyltransferase [Aurantimonas coralicida]
MIAPVKAIDGKSLITSALIRRARTAEAGDYTAEAHREAAAEMLLVLELAKGGFQEGKPTSQIIERLATSLHLLRRKTTAAVWQELVAIAQGHTVMEYLLQDPLTHWSFTKPRGYSGDAGLLDIYYKHSSMINAVDHCTTLGQEIYDYTSNVPACAAGRERRRILANMVDETADRTGGRAEILSVAAGHLRESEICESLNAGQIKRWVALDQDPISVGTMIRDLATTVVEPVNGSVLGLLRRSYKLGTFDLVYASGLYDYLQHKTAVKLTKRLADMLKPGGTLMFANFSDEIVSDGYMEAFMDWPLILRSADEMWNIINDSVDGSRCDANVFHGENRNVVYGTLRHR